MLFTERARACSAAPRPPAAMAAQAPIAIKEALQVRPRPPEGPRAGGAAAAATPRPFLLLLLLPRAALSPGARRAMRAPSGLFAARGGGHVLGFLHGRPRGGVGADQRAGSAATARARVP